MSKIEWLSTNQLQIAPPKRTKKITGTRFGAILGKNVWTTDFECWCAITKTYEKPFEDTKYTIAGKTIEPKQAEFLRKKYFVELKRPEDVWGDDFFNLTRGDFFSEFKHFGGMWDALTVEDDIEDGVVEFKTSSRPQDWEEDIPEYYALQAALYAHLKGLDQVYMVATFLKDKDYEHPEDFKVTMKNTKVFPFKVSERYPNFQELVNEAVEWWETYVESGISPKFDEKRDSEILNALRKVSVSNNMSEGDIYTEAENLINQLDQEKKKLKPLEDRLKVLQTKIKENMMSNFDENVDKVEHQTSAYVWTVSRTVKNKVDEEALKNDGLLEKYSIPSESYTLTKKAIKEVK